MKTRLYGTAVVAMFLACSDSEAPPKGDFSGLANADGWLFADASGKIVFGASATAPAGFTALAGNVEAGTDAKTTSKADGYFKLEKVPVHHRRLRVTSAAGGATSELPVTLVSDVVVRLGEPAVTREQAIAAVRDRLKSERDLDTLLVMAPHNTFPAKVIAASSMGNPQGGEDLNLALTLGAEQQWFFFIDPYFDLFYQHPVIYATVDAVTAAVSLHTTATAAPLINGFSFYYRSGSANLESPDLVSAPTKPPAELPGTVRQSLTIEMPKAAPAVRPQHHVAGCTDPKSYALMINGGDEFAFNWSTSSMRSMLEGKEGVAPENITQFSPLHDGLVVNAIVAALGAIKAKLRPCDTLWIYVAAHGYSGAALVDLFTKSGSLFKKYKDEEKQVLDVANLDVRDIKACHFYAVVDSCFSGDWITNANATGFQDQLQGKRGLEAVVVTAADPFNPGTFVRTPFELQIPQLLFTKHLIEGLDAASGALGTRATLDIGFDAMMSDLRKNANDNISVPTVTGLYNQRVLNGRPQVWTRPIASGETCDGLSIDDAGTGVSLDDSGVGLQDAGTKQAVKLDVPLGNFPAGTVIPLDRVTDGRVAQIDAGCDGLHLHANGDPRVGIHIDGTGPYPDNAPTMCGYGRIVTVSGP